jgi:hypothetical protein
MTRISGKLAVFGAVASLITIAPAQAEQSVAASCPAGYWKVDTVWSRAATGEVVPAAGLGPAQVVQKMGGKAEDWKLGALCAETASGDVVIVDAAIQPAAIGSTN